MPPLNQGWQRKIFLVTFDIVKKLAICNLDHHMHKTMELIESASLWKHRNAAKLTI